MGEACLNLDAQFRGVRVAGGLRPAWYAVQTAYRCEQRLAQGIAAKGIETYLPLLREVHQWKDRRKVVHVPAFSGYLFVRCEPSLQNRVRVLETNGAVRLLGGNHTPSAVPDLEIEALRLTLASGVECARCDVLTPGALVRVVRGPLTGVLGRLVRIKNNIRLVVAISTVSQAVSAELGLGDVEAVPDHLGAARAERKELTAAR